MLPAVFGVALWFLSGLMAGEASRPGADLFLATYELVRAVGLVLMIVGSIQIARSVRQH